MHRAHGAGALTAGLVKRSLAVGVLCLALLPLAACEREARSGTFRPKVAEGASGRAEGPASFCIDRRTGRFVLLLQGFAPAQGFAAGRHVPRRPAVGEYRLVPAGREGPSGFWVSPLNARMDGDRDGNLEVRGGSLRVVRSDSTELRGTFRLEVTTSGAQAPGFDARTSTETPAVATGSFAARLTPGCGPPPPGE